ncbi:hypothetical protein Forpe1208_v016661 [Fusarium oxysporum f. sp. rapae]|uniref:Uncharacterized protein n=1 Tax=Fusarium oxysporum f. sp. rapae TaxID=485398 RepID=A0A8J5NH52_FUSOX|nr:hypothetical protein Forpe1208_v016661 [Fusarium oxysporum f. sp. rapae]
MSLLFEVVPLGYGCLWRSGGHPIGIEKGDPAAELSAGGFSGKIKKPTTERHSLAYEPIFCPLDHAAAQFVQVSSSCSSADDIVVRSMGTGRNCRPSAITEKPEGPSLCRNPHDTPFNLSTEHCCR